MKLLQVLTVAILSLAFLTANLAAQTPKLTPFATLGETDFAMPQAVGGLAMSPDGKTLIVYGRDGSVRLFDNAGRLQKDLRVPGDAVAAALDQGGKRVLYVTRRGELGATTLAGANTRLVNEIDRVTRIAAFNNSAKGMACWGMINGVSIWDTATGKTIAKMETSKIMAEKLVLSDDNSLLLAAGFDNDAGGYRVALMDLTSGKEIKLDLKAVGLELADQQPAENEWAREHPKTANLAAAAFSSDGKLLALANESKVTVYDIAGKKSLASVGLAPGRVCFLDSDRKLAVLGDGKLVVWNIKDNKEAARIAVPAGTTAMALSADGSTALTALANGLSLWDMSSGKKLLGTAGHQGMISSVAWANNNELLSAARDGSVIKWKPPGGFDMLVESKEQGNWFVSDKTAVGLTANDKTFAAFDLDKRKEYTRWERDPQGQVLSMALSPDGQLLAAAGSVADIVVFSTLSGAPVQQPKSEESEVVPVAAPVKGPRPDTWINYSAAFSNDGKYLAIGGSGVAVFDLLTGQEVLRKKTGQWKVAAVAWSPDDRKVLLIGYMSNQLVDLASEHATSLGPNRQEIAAAAFDKSGQVLAMAQGRGITLLQVAPDLLATSRPAPLPKEKVQALWEQIDGNDSKTAFKSVLALAEQGDAAVDVLAEQLKPLPLPPTAAKVDPKPLIAQLDSDEAQQRTDAQRKLQALGLAAKPVIQETLAGNPSPEVKTRLVAILRNWADPKAANRQELLALRGVAVLEMIGSQKAQQALQKLAEGGPGRLTFDAQAAAARVQARRSAKPPTTMPAASQPAGENK